MGVSTSLDTNGTGELGRCNSSSVSNAPPLSSVRSHCSKPFGGIYGRIVIRKLTRSTAFGLGALLLASASVVSAQYPAERPADRLSRYLHELAGDPTSLPALIGAGQA